MKNGSPAKPWELARSQSSPARSVAPVARSPSSVVSAPLVPPRTYSDYARPGYSGGYSRCHNTKKTRRGFFSKKKKKKKKKVMVGMEADMEGAMGVGMEVDMEATEECTDEAARTRRTDVPACTDEDMEDTDEECTEQEQEEEEGEKSKTIVTKRRNP
jgi:hypothetical protein